MCDTRLCCAGSCVSLQLAAFQQELSELGVQFVLLRRNLPAAENTPYRLFGLVHQLQSIPPQAVHLNVGGYMRMLGYLLELALAGQKDLARLLQQAGSLRTLELSYLLFVTDHSGSCIIE